MKYLRHKAFESEVQANRNRLEQLEQQADQLFAESEDPQSAEVNQELRELIKKEIENKINELNRQWDDLKDMTKSKGERLFDANRGILFEQSIDSLDIWVKEMEKHLQYTMQRSAGVDGGVAGEAGEEAPSTGNADLTTTNLLLDRQREIEGQLQVRQKQVSELEEQAKLLKEAEPEKSAEIDQKRKFIEERFSQIVQPLSEHKRRLQQQKRVFQFIRG